MGTEPLAVTRRALEQVEALCAHGPETAALLVKAESLLRGAPAARCGVEVALEALTRSGTHERRRVAVNALVPLTTAEQTIAAARCFLGRGYRTLKLKVGVHTLEQEYAVLSALRESVGFDVALRLDANGAWTRAEAERAFDALARLGPQFVEQPLPARKLEGLAALAARGDVRVALDESLALDEGRQAAAEGLAPVVILKPMVLGGPHSVRALARASIAAGTRCVVTTTFDGPVGTAAALALAAEVGDRAWAHGLAASEAVATPFPAWLQPRDGWLDAGALP
jgi:o-succinylbenzoate synthase